MTTRSAGGAVLHTAQGSRCRVMSQSSPADPYFLPYSLKHACMHNVLHHDGCKPAGGPQRVAAQMLHAALRPKRWDSAVAP